jgi:RimJ/RimL family protein N-acetyltransferase
MRFTTTRLILREYAADDLDALRAYQTDPRAREFYAPDEGLPDGLPDLLRTFLDWAAEVPRRNWQLAIATRREPCALVGSCGLRRAGMEPGHAELGLDLAPGVWGRGYGTEAATALLDFGFDELGLVAVRGRTVSANVRIAGLVARLGFTPVGTSEGPPWMAGRGWSVADWELRRQDWTDARRGVVHDARAAR